MISFDRFHDNGDGTALWVWRANEAFDGETGEDYLSPLNRPCDTCGGSGNETMDSMLAVGVPGGQYPIGPCPACHGRKRHTFTVETYCEQQCDVYPCKWTHNSTCSGGVRTLTVHVIDVTEREDGQWVVKLQIHQWHQEVFDDTHSP